MDVAAATLLTALVVAPRVARAQDFASEAALVEGDSYNRYRSPQRFAFELTFGPYRPDIDCEFSGGRAPYTDYFGSGQHLLTRVEFDYQFWHRYGSIAAGSASATSRSPARRRWPTAPACRAATRRS